MYFDDFESILKSCKGIFAQIWNKSKILLITLMHFEFS